MEPQYYILKPAVDTPETGRAYPAVESYPDYDFNGPRSVHKLRAGEFPDFEPDIRFKLARGAKLCDMMSQATINADGFIISEKLKNIFESINSVPFKIFDVPIEHKGEQYNYYWIHFCWKESYKYLKFEESDFYARRFSQILGKVVIKSEEDIINERDKLDIAGLIDYNSLKILPNKLDILTFRYSTKIYITQRFKILMEQFLITGIDLKPTNEIVIN
jgi:hypothetical protein